MRAADAAVSFYHCTKMRRISPSIHLPLSIQLAMVKPYPYLTHPLVDSANPFAPLNPSEAVGATFLFP
jgi:hypothetical protein